MIVYVPCMPCTYVEVRGQLAEVSSPFSLDLETDGNRSFPKVPFPSLQIVTIGKVPFFGKKKNYLFLLTLLEFCSLFWKHTNIIKSLSPSSSQFSRLEPLLCLLLSTCKHLFHLFPWLWFLHMFMCLLVVHVHIYAGRTCWVPFLVSIWFQSS